MGAEHPIRRSTTARALAHRLGASPRTVRNIIAEPRAEYLARAARRRDRIAELRRQGWTLTAIATELNTTVNAVGITLHRLRQAGANVPPRSNRGRKPTPKPEDPQPDKHTQPRQ